jgi:enoyl-CoA hydratase/carnithine racemase
VTTAEGKIYSNGLDLDWMGANPDAADEMVRDVQRLLARILVLPMPTVAAVPGHAFAAGAMMVLAHDLSVMRADRGFFCLPEVDIGLPFTPGMTALITARLSPATAHEAMTTGRRYGGVAAQQAGIVSAAAAEDAVLATAVGRAEELAVKAGPVLGAIKTGLYPAAVQALTTGPAGLP